jgi:diguanylate cyclase (GGDEF)-like protein
MEGHMKDYRIYLKHYIILWAAFGAITLFLVMSFRNNRSQQFENDTVIDFSSGWKLADGTPVEINDIAKSRPSGESLAVPTVIYNNMPLNLKYGDCICFLSKNMNFRIQIDGKPLYRYWPQMDRLSGKSYGTSYHIVKVPVNFSGKRVQVFIYPKYKDNSCFFSEMCIGQTGVYYRMFLKQHVVAFMICLLIMNIGLVMILISSQQWSLDSGAAYSLMSLGTLSVMIGLWSSLQTNMPQMFLGFTPFFHLLEYSLMLFMPYPAIQYANYIIERPRKIYSLIMLTAIIAGELTCLISTLTGFRDFHECIPLIHAVVLLGFVILIIMLVKDYMYRRSIQYKDKKVKINMPVVFGFAFFILSTLTDLVLYATNGGMSKDPGRYMRIGALVNTSILMGFTIDLMLKNMKIAGETEAIKKMAYTDALTNMPNRTAYLKSEAVVQNDLLAGRIKRVMVVQFDVNNLKKVNDKFGHSCGDQFIIKASDVLSRSFGNKGECFRVGGDEFTAFITIKDETDPEVLFRQLRANMEALLSESNDKPGTLVPLTIASGFSVYDGNNIITIENAEVIADQNMYADKKHMKEDIE